MSTRRFACINNAPILRRPALPWILGRRPDKHPGLSDLGFYHSNQ